MSKILSLHSESRVHYKPISVMKDGFSQLMKTGFPCVGKLHRENPVLALYWPCTGWQCDHGRSLKDCPISYLKRRL
jgi:hypothetical protein